MMCIYFLYISTLIGNFLASFAVSSLNRASGSDSNNTGTITTNGNSTSGDSSTSTQQIQTLNVGDTWTVDGQWKLTIDSVKSTSDRNQFSDVTPQQVVIVTYTYENLGYESDFMDGLYFDLSQNGDASIVDATGKMAVSYPEDISKYPQEVPVGAKCSGAQACVGLMNTSDTITMTVNKYDSNSNSQSVKCSLKVD